MSKFVGSLEEFLSLDYKLEIIPFEEEEEKGFVIKSPEIKGLEVFGETMEEALEEVNEAKKALYQIYQDKKIPIKYPIKYQSDREDFSGRMTIRIPKNLHGRIYDFANTNGVSLNTGIIQLLNDGLRLEEMDSIKELLLESIHNVNREVSLVVNFEEVKREIKYEPPRERFKDYPMESPFIFIDDNFHPKRH